MPLTAGGKLGPYEILERIGEGGMGTVYRARDTKLNRSVAIKVLSNELADSEARRRFQREAQMASSLNHPHILTVHDVGEIDGAHYIVTEFIDGGTLKDWAKEPRTWRDTVDLLIGVADGLAAAHAAGILHRDIKPANILVAKNGYAKLADFGLAKLEERRDPEITVTEPPTRPGVILGTFAYMSPEQASGKPLDARSDIFSFGIVLYELLAGKRPFGGATELELLRSIIDAEPEALRDSIPPSLCLVVEKALAKDAAERYQSMRELVVDLKRARRVQDTKVSTQPPPVQVHSRGGFIGTLLAAGLAAAVGIYWYLWRQDYFWTNPLADASLERVTDFDSDEVDAAISPDGKFAVFVSNRDGPYDAWVTQIGSNEFLNLTKGRVSLPIPPSPVRFVGFTGDGSQAWFGEQVSLLPNKLRTWIVSNMGGSPRAMLDAGFEAAWSPDGKQMVFHSAEAGDPIFVADRNGGDAKQIFAEKPGVHCHYLSWSPDGRYIYFVKGAPTTSEMDIWRFPAPTDGKAVDPGSAERITYHNSLVIYPVWLDARTLLYTADDGSGQQLYALDIEHRIPHRVSSGVAEQYLSISASTTKPPRLVATVANPSATLWTVPVSDRMQTEDDVRRLATPNAKAAAPRFGPGYLLFLSSKGGGNGLWKFESGSSRELWNGARGGLLAAPAISPDGAQICFSARAQGRDSLYVMNADGTNVHALVDSFPVRGIGSWSPDGAWIAFAGNPGDGTSIFKVPAAGGPPVRLLKTLSYHPVWSPDGRIIVYAEPQQGGGNLPVKAVTPDGKPVPIPDIQVTYLGSPYRFVPHSNVLVYLRATADIRKRNFYRVDLDTGRQRQLTDLKSGFLMQNFDISADGKQIAFDRTRENSDVVVIDLPRQR